MRPDTYRVTMTASKKVSHDGGTTTTEYVDGETYTVSPDEYDAIRRWCVTASAALETVDVVEATPPPKTKDGIKANLDDWGVTYPASATKDALVELWHEFNQPEED